MKTETEKLFNDFKTEIVKRCKENNACQQEFKRVLSSGNFEQLVKVLTDNFSWSCENKVLDGEILESVGNEILNKYDLSVNISVKSGYLLACGNSIVEVCGNSTVQAWGHSTVKAGDNSTVKAWGHSTVEVWGNSTVEAGGNSYTCSYSAIAHKVSGNAILRYFKENKIVLAKENEIIKY